MSAVASLGMYDGAELQAANDSLWAEAARPLRRFGFDAPPERLDRARPLDEVWRDPDLLLAQTCGYPQATTLHRRGPAGLHARLRGARVRRAAVPRRRGGQDRRSLVTGAHRESLAAVADGRADFAAIDCVTVADLVRDAPETVRGTRILRWTALTPGLPLVTGVNTPPERVPMLRQALRLAIRAVGEDVRERLMLQSFAFLRTARYSGIAEMKQEAAALGYPNVC